MRTIPQTLAVLLTAILAGAGNAQQSAAGAGETLAPLADVHLHYNWDQVESIDVAEALRRLRRNGVVLGVVSSKPPALAAELAAAAGDWVVPLFMPYLEPERKRDWFRDERVLPAARAALASGAFKGLGEMHLIVGFSPSLEHRDRVIDGMLELAVEFDVPASVHAEASSHRFFRPLCRRHPGARIYWAHAGGVLPPEEVTGLLRACPNVWIDLSARDPMRYGKVHPITDASGRLMPAWRELVIEFQDRVMVGTDPFFKESLDSWDEPNTGWDHIDAIVAFHRRWIHDLPADVARKVRLDNAVRFFRIDASTLPRP